MTPTENQFGYDLIRNDILRTILGKEHDTILYWVGKSLARQHPIEVQQLDDLSQFFLNANWGTLSLLKETKRKKLLELSGDWMGKNDKRCYQLEAGFLAQQYENTFNVFSVATYERKKEKVIFTIEFEEKI